MKNQIEKHIGESFNYQVSCVNPIADDVIAGHIEAIVHTVRGHSNFEVKAGDTIFKYFIKTPNGELFLKYGKTVSGIVAELTEKRDVRSIQLNGGIPIFKI